MTLNGVVGLLVWLHRGWSITLYPPLHASHLTATLIYQRNDTLLRNTDITRRVHHGPRHGRMWWS